MTCAIAMGVCVLPGPECAAMSPAIMRTSAPPSCDVVSVNLLAEIP